MVRGVNIVSSEGESRGVVVYDGWVVLLGVWVLG